MRIPIPERIQVKHALIFAVLLVIAQQIVHTDITFSLLSGLYAILFAVAFNAGGGFFYLAGAYIFFNGILTTLLGLVYKTSLGEAGETHLTEPNKTMFVYCVGMAALGLAAALSHRLKPSRALFPGLADGDIMKRSAIGCFFLGVLLQILASRSADDSGSISSAISQVNHFTQMSIILGTTYAINSSKGKKSTIWVVWAAGAWLLYFGLVNFSKEGMLVAPLAYLIPAIALRYSFSKKQVVGAIVAGYIMLHYLVPFSQYGRNFRTETGGSNAIAAFEMLRHPEATRQLYLEAEQGSDIDGAPHFYDEPQGAMDREVMLPYDDAIIHYTDLGNIYGLTPIYYQFLNVIPHFLWKDKPGDNAGNSFAHEIGVLADDDTTTGISFSPTGDAYHEAGWFGVLIVLPVITFMLFILADSLAGDVRRSPWNLLLIALCSHIAPEGLMQGTIYVMTYCILAIFITSMLAKYVLPVITNLMAGGERTRVQRTATFHPPPRSGRLEPGLRRPESDLPSA